MKILRLLGRHNFQVAHGYIGGKPGYCIHECMVLEGKKS